MFVYVEIDVLHVHTNVDAASSLQHQAMRVPKQTCTCEALTSVNGATLTKQCAAEIPA